MHALLIVTTVLGALQAQELRSAIGSPPAIRVQGEATVSAEPDQAQFDIGVVTQAPGVSAAVNQNAAQTNAAMRELKSLVPDKDIKTVNFSVNPNYRYPKEGAAPTIDGYTVSNTVRLTLNDLSKIPTIIKAATKSGANNIDRLSFLLKDEKPVRAKALASAAMQAETSAEALAGSLKLKLGRLLQVEEGQPVVISPVRAMSFGRAAAAETTPISPGTIDIHANVTLTYEIVQDR